MPFALLQSLLDDAYAHHAQLGAAFGPDRAAALGANTPAPVLWFGDLQQWYAQQGGPRVITAGVNPGPLTFAPPNPAPGAPWWQGIDSNLPTYAQCLANYVQTWLARPRDRNWFGAYAPVLGAFGASFDAPAARPVLHTDIFSPIATKLRWSKLEPAERAQLEAVGIQLWLRLLALLQPDVVVLSLNQAQWLQISPRIAAAPEVVRFEAAHAANGAPFANGHVWRLSTATAQVPAIFQPPGGAAGPFAVVRGSKLFAEPFSGLDHARLAQAGIAATQALGLGAAAAPDPDEE